MSRHFSEEDVHMAIECMKKCSTSLLFRDTKIKPQCDATIHPPELAKIKNLTIASLGQDMEQLELSYIPGRVYNGKAILKKLCNVL